METSVNSMVLQEEMDWLEEVINQVIKSYFLQEGHENNWYDINPPDIDFKSGPFAETLHKWQPDLFERLALALALAPHLRPEALDIFFGKNQVYDRGFTEFGGLLDKNHSGFLPTVQTFCFLITAVKPEWRAEVARVLSPEAKLIREQMIILGEAEHGMPAMGVLLGIHTRWVHYFLTGQMLQEENTAAFPAQRITTNLNWEDVVLGHVVMDQVLEIKKWMEYSAILMEDWGLQKMLKPGYRALFYGPPGTGKTLTATLLGKANSRDVYKVDLSLVVSKYIGETEKNLSRIFDTAKYKDWILFFDEADALFGKRTAAQNSNDRHANQQTAYLLQRIEDFPGVVILASNLKANMDEAFSRRFQSVIHFDMPGEEERYRLWQQAFSGICKLHPDIDVHQLAADYEIAGGAIINILRNCALSAISRNDTVVLQQDLFAALRREYKKENKTILFN
jgi:AAA+ superfamily predicted ATPase